MTQDPHTPSDRDGGAPFTEHRIPRDDGYIYARDYQGRVLPSC
jgi:hypothetical protein